MAFKGGKATCHANLVAFPGDKLGHHRGIRFGWGYCQVVFPHEAGG